MNQAGEGHICGNCANWRCDDNLHLTGYCILSRLDKFHGADACSKYEYMFKVCTNYYDKEPEMTDEEAIKWLTAIKDKEFDRNRRIALDIAIKALEERSNR
jgi:hypothetical protein